MVGKYWPAGTKVIHLVDAEAKESAAHLGISNVLQMERSAASLLEQLEKHPHADILLQYAGRGYDRYGCPFWMLSALKKWRKNHPAQKLVVFFHELWGKVPWTNKLIITETASRWISRRLASLADVVLTNTPHHSERLSSAFGIKAIDYVPVGANISPEGSTLLPFSKRNTGDFAVLTAPYGRLLMFKEMSESLKTLHQKGLLNCLHIIGPSDPRWTPQEKEILDQCLPPEKVKVHGILPVEEVSHVLNSCAFALLCQAEESLLKSTAFMAFASHQNVVVNPLVKTWQHEPQSYLVKPEDIWEKADNPDYFSRKGLGLHQWYLEHASWQRITHKLATACQTATATNTATVTAAATS